MFYKNPYRLTENKTLSLVCWFKNNNSNDSVYFNNIQFHFFLLILLKHSILALYKHLHRRVGIYVCLAVGYGEMRVVGGDLIDT